MEVIKDSNTVNKYAKNDTELTVVEKMERKP